MGQRILGIDIGASSVRAVVVDATNRGWTVTAALRGAIAPAIENAPPLRDRQLEALRALLSDPRLAFDSALVALPGASATHVVSLPFTDVRRIQQTIGFEVEAQIPFALDEVAWDWQPLDQREGKSELLVEVVRKEELTSLLAGLATASVDPRAVVAPGPAYASLFAAGAVAGEPGIAAGTFQALVDVGAARTSVCVVDGDACRAARTFPVGAGAGPAAIAREVRSTLRAWRARSGPSAPPLRRLVVAADADLVRSLAEALGPEVEGPIEPLALGGPAAVGLASEDAPSGFALALALALRGQQGARAGRLNLRRGELAFTRDFEHLRGKVARLGAWAALVLLLAMVSSAVKVFALSRQERLLDGALCDATQKLVGKCYVNDELAVAALRGKGTAAASIPKNSAVDIFTELAARNPADVAVRYDRIEITRDKLHLQGTTEAAENVDKIVSALRTSRCFGDARSGGARKRSLDGKFEFTIDSDLTCDTGDKPATRS